MSRLFDALKEATRFRENANAGEVVWKALGINGAEIVPGLYHVNADEAESGPRTAVPSGEAVSAAVEEERLPSATPSMKRSLGIPTKVALDKKARLIPHGVDPVVIERYRMLRTKIMQQREKLPCRSLVVTSASPQEGKSVTVLNLAMSFAMLQSFKVLVVDGDMRRGTLGSWLGVDRDHPGLSNLIDGSAQLEDVVLTSNELPMHFLVSGNSQVHDLSSSHLTNHFRRMTEQFDLVLVDSPPANLVTDVQLLAANCDAVLLVARAFSTTRKAFEEAVHNLQPFRVIGTVLNAGTAQRSSRYHGYY
jgi:capsular exopolysaccharide synthesis family protein